MAPAGEPSSTGLDAHVAGALAYLAGPFSGLLVLLAERTSSSVRFHAWQSLLGLGVLGAIAAALYVLAFLSLFFAATGAFRILLAASWIVCVLWLACWAICLVKAFTRRRWKLPIAGTYAERLAGKS